MSELLNKFKKLTITKNEKIFKLNKQSETKSNELIEQLKLKGFSNLNLELEENNYSEDEEDELRKDPQSLISDKNNKVSNNLIFNEISNFLSENEIKSEINRTDNLFREKMKLNKNIKIMNEDDFNPEMIDFDLIRGDKKEKTTENISENIAYLQKKRESKYSIDERDVGKLRDHEFHSSQISQQFKNIETDVINMRKVTSYISEITQKPENLEEIENSEDFEEFIDGELAKSKSIYIVLITSSNKFFER